MGVAPQSLQYQNGAADGTVSQRAKRAHLPIIMFGSWKSGPFSLSVPPFWISYGTTVPFVSWPMPCLVIRVKILNAMKRPLIPWHVFREAIAAQDSALLKSWLDRWGFTDDGVVLIGAETYSHAPVLPSRDFEKRRSEIAPSAIQTSILRALLDTGRLLSEEIMEPWSCSKEL